MGGKASHVASRVAAFILCRTTGLALGASGGGGELASLAATERRAVVEFDLWMPSTAAARAWARRTVTMTVYG